MELFVVIIALAFLQVWGSSNPLHRDGWFRAWVKTISSPMTESLRHGVIGLMLFIGIPAAILWWVMVFLIGHSIWILLPVSVVILLYSFGRGEFREIVREYTQACYVEDWSSALDRASRFDVDTRELEDNDWASLNRRVFEQAAYRGFERMFGVLFWFFLLGPIAAFVYRLLVIFVHDLELPSQVEVISAHKKDEDSPASSEVKADSDTQAVPEEVIGDGSMNAETIEAGEMHAESIKETDESMPLIVQTESIARRVLRYAEWPAARILGLTFALTGNFATSLQAWSKGLIQTASPTRSVLRDACLGALSVSEELQADCEITRKELNLLTRLYTRTLWLWLVLAAFFFLYA